MNDKLYHLFRQSSGISTDTRSLKEGNLFFAIRGPHFNANAFVSEALSKGAIGAVVDDPAYVTDDRCIRVKDVLTSLQDLAVKYRNKLQIPIIGITGSNGKTTTKELVSKVLSVKFRTWCTQGNLNNHIGVPLTILSIPEDTETAIVEMGANKIGDIEELCRIARPTHGLITNIGRAHLEGFGDINGVLRAKTELYQHLIKNNGVVFINSTDPVLSAMMKRFKDPVTYPAEKDFFHCRFTGASPLIEYETSSGERIKTGMTGSYNFLNIASALCIGKYFGVNEARAHEAISGYIPANNRSQLIHTEKNTLLMDAYNANPSSMEAALFNFETLKADHKTVILGDMFELGQDAVKEHKKIGQITSGMNIHTIIFCGPLMEHAHQQDNRSFYYTDKETLLRYLENNPIRNSLVLIKASRGMKLETLIDQL